MKKFLIALALLATIGAIFANSLSEIDLIMDSMKGKPKKEQFKVFHFLHKKTYALDSEEGIMRYKIFKQNMNWVNEKNSKLGKQVYGLTPFMDITDEEFRKIYLMDSTSMQLNMRDFQVNFSNNKKVEVEKSKMNRNINFELTEDDDVPEQKLDQTTSSIDWRNIMNPPKDQKSCGSCWSFAAMGAVEGNYNIAFQTLPNLSEQYLVDCDTNDNGCNGGWPTKTFEWLKSNGVVDSTDAPYTAKQTLCKLSEFQSKRKNLIKGFSYCEKGLAGKECTKEIWLSLLSRGPLVVAMDASDAGFSKYKPLNGEAWVPATCGKINHAVVAVGFVTENGSDYIIVRNSWGLNWGMAGYFKVPADKHCGILDYAWLPEVQKGDEAFPEQACPVFYSQCDFLGKTVSSCDGVSDFTAAIGGKAASFNKNNSNAPYFNMFSQPNCKGTPMWNYDTFKCDASHWNYKTKPIYSAASDSVKLPWGCIMHYSSSCFTGNKTLLCNSVADLASAGFTFGRGSFYINNYTVKSIVFFEETKFQGKAFGIKNKSSFNTDDVTGFNDILAKAKSVLIIPRDIYEPYDPNW